MRAKSVLRMTGRSEDGFTFVEIIASILILSIIGFLIWQGSSIAARMLFKSSDRSIATLSRLQLDEALRRETGNILIPFWISRVEIETSHNRIRIPYYQGDPDDHLVIEVIGDSLTITAPGRDEYVHFGPFPGISAAPARDTEGNPIGINLKYASSRTADARSEILYRFGSFPLWSADDSG